ncbi:unnamed protein product [Paramecium octaurelia]|uniref:G domain-containing protein n=1 Tax=Paramecium octaurelia TaxID=43137 RepID=A0A8S1TII3_PAROT|nr:unnamed protein product [Paramecium octaurelia]
MDQNDSDDQESILMNLIGKFQKLIAQFDDNNKKRNISVVLLVGLTGSGKSTIFNFLSGADFTIDENKELLIKNPSNRYSKMIGGMNSITKEPNFYHNYENNHLIIDFPGFQDTSGDWDRLLFELLFHKIATSGPIKIIYVIKNPENNLPNRGSDLQEFIKQVFLKGNDNIQKFNLLLNCYLEDLSEEKLQNKIKDDLNSVNLSQQIDKILVVRKAKKIDQLQLIFNDQQRQILLQQIKQMQPITIQPQKLPKSEIISDYLRTTTLKTIEKYGNILCDVFDNSYTKLSESQSKKTEQEMQQLLQVIKKDNQESPLNWYINFISICEELAQNLSSKCDIMNSSNNFKEIFVYFSQFSDLIKGYEEMTIMKSIAKDQLRKIEKIISTRLEFLEKAQQDRAKIIEIENQQSQLQQTMDDYRSQIYTLENTLDTSNNNYSKEISCLKLQLELAINSHKNLNIEQMKELERQNQRQKEDIQQLQQQIRDMNKTEEYQQTIRNQRDRINNMEQKIKDLENRSRGDGGSGCQLI